MKTSFSTVAAWIAVVSIIGVEALAQRSAKPSSPSPPPNPNSARERATQDKGFALEHAGDGAKAGDNYARNRLLLQYKEVKEDFSRIQIVNNQLRLAASDPSKLDASEVARSAEEVNRRAKRIKSKLALPETEKRPESADSADTASISLIVKQILQLDDNITAFVSNPMFRDLDLVDARAASVSLQDVIRTSALLGRTARRAGKAERR
jgi:hypothetical protein